MNLQVELARQDRTFIHVPALALEIGSFGEVASAHVSRIIDGQNMLAAVLGKEVWVSGIPTQGVVDGETVKIGRTMVVEPDSESHGSHRLHVGAAGP